MFNLAIFFNFHVFVMYTNIHTPKMLQIGSGAGARDATWAGLPSTDRSLPGSPNSSMDMSVMSASDLTSIGFDSTADCDADLMAETPIRPGAAARAMPDRGTQFTGFTVHKYKF
jgi:hypothetical protein